MAKKRYPLASIKLVRRKSTPLTTIVVAAAIVLSIAALLSLNGAIRAANARTEALRQEAIQLEQEYDRLTQYQNEHGTVQEALRVAQEQLGLVPPDSVIIQPE